jgi:hypothetical protein
MSLGDTFENDLLKQLFHGTAIANIADNAASSPLTSFYVAFHTGNPGEAGDQTTNECAYGSYARVAVARTSGGWTITDNSVSPAANVDLPEATSGTETATHFSVGTDATGTGKILVSGTLSPNIGIVTGVIPRLKTSTTITLD